MVRDSLLVIVDPVPVVNAGPDQQICANNSNVQLNGFVGNAPGGAWSGGAGTFFPSNTMLATQYMPTAAEVASGSLTLTLTSTGTDVLQRGDGSDDDRLHRCTDRGRR